jgi:hypothetical protein
MVVVIGGSVVVWVGYVVVVVVVVVVWIGYVILVVDEGVVGRHGGERRRPRQRA